MPVDLDTRPPPIWRQWQDLKPTDLSPRREAREARAARRLSQRSTLELGAVTQARALVVQAGLRKFKQELTFNRYNEMVQVARELKPAVHQLRISVRAQNLQSGARALPSRAVQWENLRLPTYALAWVHTLDMSLQELGCDPGPLIMMWNMQCHIAPLSRMTRYGERNITDMLRRDRLLLEAAPPVPNQALRHAQTRKQTMYHQGLLLDEVTARAETAPGHPSALDDMQNYQNLVDAVGRLRAAVLTYQHPATPLPPHPEQYTVAGSTWMSNRRHWRQAMRDWLGDVDEAHPPAYADADAALPSYRLCDEAAPPYRRHRRSLSGPWVLWPKRFLLRSRTM